MTARIATSSAVATFLALAVGVGACESSTTGADFMAASSDAGEDAIVLGPETDAGVDAGEPELPECVACAAKGCQEQLSFCGEPCAQALFCMERCETLTCREECLRDADVVAIAGVKSCLIAKCTDACPVASAYAVGVTGYAQVYCSAYAVCAPSLLAYEYGDLAGCQRGVVSRLAWESVLPGSGATGRRLVDCANEINQITCDDFRSARLEWTCPIRGKRALGEPCLAAAQCESGFCPTEALSCGACKNPPALNAKCATGSWCGWGQVCDFSDGTSTGTCRFPVRGGGACGAGKPCEGRYQCISGACTAKPASAGAACGSSTSAPFCDEAAGYVCSNSTSGTCIRYAVADAGAACGTIAGVATICRNRAACVSGKCAAPPDIDDACDLEEGPFCVPPAQCVSGKCVDLPAAGTCR